MAAPGEPLQPAPHASSLAQTLLLATIALALLGIAAALFLTLLSAPAPPPPPDPPATPARIGSPGIQPGLPVQPSISAQPQGVRLGTAQEADRPGADTPALSAQVSLLSPNAAVRYVNARIETSRDPAEFRLESNTCTQTASQPRATACQITLRWNPRKPGRLADTFLVIDARPPDPLPGQPEQPAWQPFSHYVPVSGEFRPAPNPLEVRLEDFRFPHVEPGETHRLTRRMQIFNRPVRIQSVRRDADTVAMQDTLSLSGDCSGTHSPAPPQPAWCEIVLLWTPTRRTPAINALVHVDYAEIPANADAPPPQRQRLTVAVTAAPAPERRQAEPAAATLSWSETEVDFGSVLMPSPTLSRRLRLIAGPADVRLHGTPVLFAPTPDFARGIQLHPDPCLQASILRARHDCPLRIDWTPAAAIDATVILRWSAAAVGAAPRELVLPLRGRPAPPKPEEIPEPFDTAVETFPADAASRPPASDADAAASTGTNTQPDATRPRTPEPGPQDAGGPVNPLLPEHEAPAVESETTLPGPQREPLTADKGQAPETPDPNIGAGEPSVRHGTGVTRLLPVARPDDYTRQQAPTVTAARHDVLTRRSLPVLHGPGAVVIPDPPADPGRAPAWTHETYAAIGIEPAAGRSSRPVPLTAAVLAGTPIPAVLSLTVDSRRPTPVTAVVERDIHASHGRALVIPRGSRLIGRTTALNPAGTPGAAGYDTALQGRLQVEWRRLVRPDGAAFSPSAELRTTDLMGRPGLPGRVDRRELALFLTALSNIALQAGSTALLATDVTRIATPGQGGTVDLPGNAAPNVAPGTGNAPGSVSYSARISAGELARHQARAAILDVLRAQMAAALPPPPAVTVPAGTRMVIVPAIDLWLAPAIPHAREPAIPHAAADEGPGLTTSIPLTAAEQNPGSRPAPAPAPAVRPYVPPPGDPYSTGYDSLFRPPPYPDAGLDATADSAATEAQDRMYTDGVNPPESGRQAPGPTLLRPQPPERTPIWR